MNKYGIFSRIQNDTENYYSVFKSYIKAKNKN